MCKKYLNVVTGNVPVLLIQDKKLTYVIYRPPFYVIIYRSYNFLKTVRVFWTTLYIVYILTELAD